MYVILLTLLIMLIALSVGVYCTNEVIIELRKLNNFKRYFVHFIIVIICLFTFLIGLFEFLIAIK
jgi:hypothetical protein